MRFVMSLLIAILAFGSFGFQAAASGPGVCQASAIVTGHSKYFDPECDQSREVLVDYTEDGSYYVARIVNTAKSGLTPRYNAISVSKESPNGSTQEVWRMGFSMNFMALVSVPGFLVSVVDFGGGNEGLIIWNTKDPTRLVPIDGTNYQRNEIKATYNEISVLSVGFDGKDYLILVGLNRADNRSHLRGELLEYHLGSTGSLTPVRSWITYHFIDDFATTYGGNLEIAMRDKVVGSNKLTLAYLAIDDPTRFHHIGTR